MPYDPNYVPSGVNNKDNPWYEGYNHTKISRSEENRSEFLTSPIAVIGGGTAVSYHAYTEADLLNTHPNYTTLTSTANYVTEDGATINAAYFTVNGTQQIGTFVLSTADKVELVVTDTNTNTRTWTIDSYVDSLVVSITATIPVTMTPLYNTQAISDVENYAQKVATSNFTSNVGTIVSAVVEALEDALDVNDPLAASNDASYNVLVTDDQGNTENFTSNSITVEAMYTAEAISGGTIEITSVSSLPDGAVLLVPAIIVSSVNQLATVQDALDAMAGTPVALLAPSAPTGTTGLGDTLTGVDDLVVLYSVTEPVNTYSWEADGVPISGATGLTFVITASEQDTDVTFLVKPGTGTAVESSPISIPAAAGGPITATLATQGEGTTSMVAASIPLTGIATNEPLYIGVVVDSSARYPTNVDVGGNDASSTPLVELGAAATVVPNCSWWKVLKPATDTPDLTITLNAATANWFYFIYTLDAVASVSASLAAEMASSGNSLTLDTATVTDQVVLMIAGEDRGTNDIGLTGVTAGTKINHSVSTTLSANSGQHTATSTENPRALTSFIDPTGNTNQMSGAVIVLG